MRLAIASHPPIGDVLNTLIIQRAAHYYILERDERRPLTLALSWYHSL
jgi:hypothetical protein